MAEILKSIALREFGTLEGVTISYTIDWATGKVNYFLSRTASRPEKG